MCVGKKIARIMRAPASYLYEIELNYIKVSLKKLSITFSLFLNLICSLLYIHSHDEPRASFSFSLSLVSMRSMCIKFKHNTQAKNAFMVASASMNIIYICVSKSPYGLTRFEECNFQYILEIFILKKLKSSNTKKKKINVV